MFCPHRSSKRSGAIVAAFARARAVVGGSGIDSGSGIGPGIGIGRACLASFSGSAKLSRASPAGFAKSALPSGGAGSGGKSAGGGGKTRRAGTRRKEKLQAKLSGEVTERLRRRAARKEFDAQEENEALGRTSASSDAAASNAEPLSDFVRQLEADNVHQLPSASSSGTASPLRLGGGASDPSEASTSTSSPPASASSASPAHKAKRMTSAQIRSGAALSTDKLSGVATDPEHIDFYNAMEFEVRASDGGHNSTKNSEYFNCRAFSPHTRQSLSGRVSDIFCC
jgi:hypothetical protein